MAAGLLRLLAMLKGEPLEDKFTQPSMGTSQPVEVGQVVTHPLDEFHLLLQEVALQEVTEVGTCGGHADLKGHSSGSSP